ncbi:Similar to Biotin biosynthesis bifunctional protein BioAB; acc. no. E6SRG2 [Pyronema omphalodes CBS 100304]|uniref:Similar to Biotin biosynthesis bifunctional protein BioAB acc. no. E6SRG2 n=1 Tax=Pyronema omphalodes (strain CBS 100304) TaxID=1076935 RepID=U4KXR7_PYROM|nr:Similar to Biotin biosynthesis bifunctional protein BioAB; acc. no. E6SRG2 [Pyronema omphalodes CBS 100304]
MRFPSKAISSTLSARLRAFQIYGANTNVGKTIVSTILCKALKESRDASAQLLKLEIHNVLIHQTSHVSKFSGVTTSCLWQFNDPVSPHLAVPQELNLTDSLLLDKVHNHISSLSNEKGTFILETAGGVHSPTPSGSSQADAYRPLRLPIILIADPALGGISASISAYESLHIRGYDVDRVVVFSNEPYRNDSYLSPKDVGDEEQMLEYYARTAESQELFDLIGDLHSRHAARIQDIKSMPQRAADKIWYPFTQHTSVAADNIRAIDSAHGDHFSVYTPPTVAVSEPAEESAEVLAPRYDGSASWWTQGLGHSNPELALSAAYAAGRYGHVMFPGSIHSPALKLSELLLEKLDNPRLNRVFFSDNGSTGAEVAIKMGLRASRERYGWSSEDKDIGIIGLKGAYHGDTIGAMDAADPGIYNKEVEWYKGRGFWFDFPKVGLSEGKWKVEVPGEQQQELGTSHEFGSLEDIFDISRDSTELAEKYAKYIHTQLHQAINVEGRKFGALMLEPVVLGAAGMHFCDPLFQRTLINVIRNSADLFPQAKLTPAKPAAELVASKATTAWTGLPVIHDEVFTGLYRLGSFSPSHLLHVQPDISIHAKLLTGGLLPLCTTLAGEEIFKSFLSEHKHKALLHGHSYTAHAVGCQVALDSLNIMNTMAEAGEFSIAPSEGKTQTSRDKLWSKWSSEFTTKLSHSPKVESVWALGTVLAITLKAQETGYASNASGWLMDRLKGNGIDARALGNVVYVMTSVSTEDAAVRGLEEVVKGFEEW